jgi:hypothetical protein
MNTLSCFHAKPIISSVHGCPICPPTIRSSGNVRATSSRYGTGRPVSDGIKGPVWPTCVQNGIFQFDAFHVKRIIQAIVWREIPQPGDYASSFVISHRLGRHQADNISVWIPAASISATSCAGISLWSRRCAVPDFSSKRTTSGRSARVRPRTGCAKASTTFLSGIA